MDVQRLINLAAFDLGAIPSGGSLNTDELNDSLDILNQLAASLSNEDLFCYNRRHYTVALGAGVVAVTIGPGGSWATTARPVKIEGAIAYSGNVRSGLAIMSIAEAARLATNPKGITQLLPEILGVDNAAVILNGRVFPPTTGGCAIDLHTLEPMTSFATLGTALDLPPGYERAFRLLLAGELYPQFGREGGMDPALAANIQNAKAILAQLNAAVVMPQTPAAPAQ